MTAPRPRVSEHTDAARLEALRDSMRPRVEGEARMAQYAVEQIAKDGAVGGWSTSFGGMEVKSVFVESSTAKALALDLLDARQANAALTAEVEAIEAAVREVCPLSDNEGYEDEDAGAVVYRCIGEDGDPLIETESRAEVIRGLLGLWHRVSDRAELLSHDFDELSKAFAATLAQDEIAHLNRECLKLGEDNQRLTAEVARLRKFAEKMITPCEWGPSAFIEEDESDISDWALSHGLLVERVHAQPCEVEGCECDGSPTLLYFAWSPEAAALALPTNAPEAK